MLISANALGFTLALLATFVGVGLVVTAIVAYIVAQVLAERKQNQEAQPGLDR